MKLKLTGELFRNPMEYNRVSIEKDIIDIHNSNNSGIGFIQKFKSPTLVVDAIEFTLNKKDYSLIGSLKEFWIEKIDTVINVWCPGFKAKFADMHEVHMIRPTTEGLINLGVELSDLWLSRTFANKPSEEKFQYDGVTIFKDRVIASDSYCIFQKLINSAGPEVNIPKEVFKYLHPSTDYTIKTNGKLAVFQSEEKHLFYTEVIALLGSPVKLDDSGIVMIKANRTELLDKLKLIKEYSNGCHISAKDTVMTLTETTNENQLDISIKIESSDLKSLEFGTHVYQLIKMVTAVETEDITLKFDDRMVKVIDDSNNVITAAGRVSEHGKPFEVVGG